MHKFNVIVTTFEMINIAPAPNEPHLSEIHWRALVVDEAHRLKNTESKLMVALCEYSFDHLLLLTGTPLQNNHGELYALLHFLEPKSFPSEADWASRFGTLGDKEQVSRLGM